MITEPSSVLSLLGRCLGNSQAVNKWAHLHPRRCVTACGVAVEVCLTDLGGAFMILPLIRSSPEIIPCYLEMRGAEFRIIIICFLS